MLEYCMLNSRNLVDVNMPARALRNKRFPYCVDRKSTIIRGEMVEREKDEKKVEL